MTQPTQAYPPWLTPSLSTITNAAGVPVATETTIVYLPLTYYGPSIPLNSLWTFGGSTSPASSSLASTSLTTTAIPTLTTTATPTSITSLSNPASISTSNTATPISSTSTSSSSFIPSSTSIPSATATTQLSALTRGQLVGVIVASILGLIFLFVLALFLFLWCKGRRNRQFRTLVPLDLDDDGGYDVLSASDVEGYRPGDVRNGPAGRRIPGEGSPRQSGDEASSFLRQTRSGGPSVAQTSAAGAAMSQLPTELGVSRAVSRIPPPTTNSNSTGTQSSYSNASGFGVVVDRPNLGFGQLPTEQPQASGLSAADLRRLDQENENENVIPDDPDMYEDGEYTGAYAYPADTLLAPPRLLNPDYSPLNAEFPSHMSDLSDAEVLTAERRRIGSLIGPSINTDIPGLPAFGGESSQRHSGLLGAIGLSGLANLGRRSWFKSFDSQRHSPDFTVEPFTELDLETGRGMLSPERRVRSRGRNVGAGPDGSRPMSGTSGRSGTSVGTVYHDAQSSTPATPSLPTFFPRAATPPTSVPASSSGNQRATEHLSPLAGHPVYNNDNNEDNVQSPGNTDNLNMGLNFDPTNAADILDMPAPAALHHFSSLSSLKDTTTGGSFGLFPPGLDTIKPVGWSDVVTEVTDSTLPVSNFGGAFINTCSSSSGRITLDLLEDAPPGAEIGWRSIASGGFGDAGRRGTFGLIVDQSGYTSEQGSLHSMRSHFNPSVRSTGSAPASRRDGSSSMGSASSRPSAHSLARTGSISSDGRRRHQTNSPSLSAFGYSLKRPSPLSNNNNNDTDEQPLSHIPFNNIGSPPCAHVTPDKTSTIRSLGSSGGSGTAVGDAVTVMDEDSFGTVKGLPMGLMRSGSTSQMSSASFPLNAPPWAAGLDKDWVPAA